MALQNFSTPLEKCVEQRSKTLDIVSKIWAPLRKLFATPGVPSWSLVSGLQPFLFNRPGHLLTSSELGWP